MPSKRIFLGALAALLLGLSPAASQKILDSDPLEYKMACINAGRIIKKDDITVARFRFLIAELSKASGEDPERIGDMLTKSQELIQSDFGKRITILEFTEIAYRQKELMSSGGLKAKTFFAMLLMAVGRD